MNNFKVIGLMSGTSLDGLDIALISFNWSAGKWSYSILKSQTFIYDSHWKSRLKQATLLSGDELTKLDLELGEFYGQCINQFVPKDRGEIQFISSHGHTIFHQPERKITLQIGSAIAINAACNIPVVYDFRTLDILLGGQGAPLVPIGDKFLFPDYDACLNLGGIANISYDLNEERKAFDISPFNILFNHFAEKEGIPFDEGGGLASDGSFIERINLLLNEFTYFDKDPPKSLGYEEIEEKLIKPMDSFSLNNKDVLHTISGNLALKIKNTIQMLKARKVLVTGGGVYNTHFMNILTKALPEVVLSIPDKKVVEFKEAMVFAFLGVLRVRGEINVLKSVTGASRDSIGGSIIGKI